MNKQEFIKAVKLARNEEFIPIPYLSAEMGVFQDCALDKTRRYVTIEQVASLIVGHCATFAGTFDASELVNLEMLSKRFDLI